MLARLRMRLGGGVMKLAALPLAALPLLLFACLGQFSRMMGDDYARFATALQLGGRHNFLHWWNGWDGSYSGILFHDLIAPLGAISIPRVFPAVVIALWWAGLSGIFRLALDELGFRQNSALVGSALAALTTGAAVNGFYAWESIYWYTACVDNTLPVGGLLIALAIAFRRARPRRSRRFTVLSAVAAAALCFALGGFSEMYALYQVAYLSLLLAAVHRWDQSARRHARLVLLLAGGIGGLAALLTQFASPGVSFRIESAATVSGLQPLRSGAALVGETVRLSLEVLGHPGGIGGFLLLLAVGIVLSLSLFRARAAPSIARSPALATRPLALGLLAQVGCLAMLSMALGEGWMGGGALSPLEAGALASALLSGGLFLLLIWRRESLEIWLLGDDRRLARFGAAILIGALLLLAATQLPAATWPVSCALFVTALAWLGNLLALLLSSASEAAPIWISRAAILSLALAAVAIALPVAVGLYFNGVVYARVMPSAALAIVLAGLVWGFGIGILMRRVFPPGRAFSRSLRPMWMAARIAVAVMTLGIVANQLSLVPRFAAYANDWDARHERIIQMRDQGESRIEVAPFSFDMTAFIAASGNAIAGSDAYFYGVDAIIEVGS